MPKLQRLIHRPASERGFTLIELLVVIIILGILAAVVVFAVSGVGDKGKSAATTIDERTIQTAEEAYCARNGTYASGQQLVTGGFLSELPEYHQVDAQPTGGACNGWKYFILRTAQADPYPAGKWDSTPAPALGLTEFLVRLADGRVLASGADPTGTTMAAQILNPVTGIWTSVDPQPVGVSRTFGSTAILLSDDPSTPQSECNGAVDNCGKVFVHGRFLFDPKITTGAGQWQTLPANAACNICTNGSQNFTYVQLKNQTGLCGANCGNVYIFAGSGTGVLGYEVFNPRDNSYTTLSYPDTATTSLAISSYANQLSDGRVLICCMTGTSGAVPPAAKFFDPASLTFSNAPLPPAKSQQSGSTQPAPVLPNGDIFFGTFGSLPNPTQTDRYTPQVGGPGNWTGGTPCAVVNPFRCRVLGSLPDGRVLASRSSQQTSTTTTETYVYNPATSTWARTGDLNNIGSYTLDALVLDPAEGPCGTYCGKMLVAGVNTAELYTP